MFAAEDPARQRYFTRPYRRVRFDDSASEPLSAVASPGQKHGLVQSHLTASAGSTREARRAG